MEHFARFVVKRRKLVLAAAVLLLIPAALGQFMHVIMGILARQRAAGHEG